MPDPFEFFRFINMSDKDRADHERVMEAFKMEVEDFRHSFQRLFEELDQDQLSTIKTMLQFFIHSEDKEMAISLEAMVRWELKSRFNICVTCGEEHTLNLSPTSEKITVVNKKSDDEKVTSEEDIPLPFELTDQDRKDMETYHLDDLYEEETNLFLGFICTGIHGMKSGCGMRYPTLEDRKLKAPENCPGCHVKMAHG